MTRQTKEILLSVMSGLVMASLEWYRGVNIPGVITGSLAWSIITNTALRVNSSAKETQSSLKEIKAKIETIAQELKSAKNPRRFNKATAQLALVTNALQDEMAQFRDANPLLFRQRQNTRSEQEVQVRRSARISKRAGR